MKRKKRAPSVAEEKIGVERTIGLRDREFKETVTEKMGADGVIENHISYTPTKNSGFRKAGAGKGDKFRPVNKARFDANYRRIFGHD